MSDLWHALFGYRLIIPNEVIAYHAAQAGQSFATMRWAFKRYPPEVQRMYAVLTAVEREIEAVRTA